MPEDPFSLSGELALISGGGTGIGFAIAREFVRAGARVIVTGRRESVLREACDSIGPAAAYVVHDVTDHAATPQLAERVTRDHGGVTILINNAGIHLKRAAIETDPADFARVMDTHVTGAFALVRYFAPGMLERGHGCIVFMASMSSLMGIPLIPAYSAAKSAYLGLMRSLATELGPKGVRVNAIAPGWIETPMLEQALAADPARKARILARTPMDKFGEVKDIAYAARYLCSPAAKFVNGALLPVDGGAAIGF